MQVSRSALTIEKLLVVACNLATIPVNSKYKHPILNDLDLDLDFKILSNTKDKSQFIIALTLSCNITGEVKPGYSFSLASEGNFKLLGIEELQKEKVDQYLTHTALPILINHVRSYLMDMTAYYPYGQYVLPCLDLVKLLKDQQKLIDNKGN